MGFIRAMASYLDQTPEDQALPSSTRPQQTPPAGDQTVPTASPGHDTPIAGGDKAGELPDVVEIVRAMSHDVVATTAAVRGVSNVHPARPRADAALSSGAADPVPASALPPTLPPAADSADGHSPGHREKSADPTLGPAVAARSANTRRAYQSDWKQFASWCRRQGHPFLPPNPQVIGLYITALTSGATAGERKTLSTIERRLSALTWNYAQRGQPLDRKDRAIASVIADIRNTRIAPARHKQAVLPQDLAAMLETLDRGTLRGLRDRAMLLLGFAGNLRRSEIVGLDVGRDQTEDASGWIEILDESLLVRLRIRTGWREVRIRRGASDTTSPVMALQTWLKFARITDGPLFRRVTGKGKAVGADRLNAQEVARLVKRAALAAGLRRDLPEGERANLFGSQSLRAGRNATDNQPTG